MRLLEGFSVVELGMWVAAPAAAAMLADWGAEVIKVESPDVKYARARLRAAGDQA